MPSLYMETLHRSKGKSQRKVSEMVILEFWLQPMLLHAGQTSPKLIWWFKVLHQRIQSPTFIILGEQVELEGRGVASAFISTRKNTSWPKWSKKQELNLS